MAKHGLLSLIISILLSLALVAYSDENCVHTVYIKTGSEENAGTDANVNLDLYDNKNNKVEMPGIWSWGLMASGHNYFENNELDAFAVKGGCLESEPCKIKLSHDNTGDKPGWYVAYVEVTSTGPQRKCTQQKFPINTWLAKDEPYTLSITKDECFKSPSDLPHVNHVHRRDPDENKLRLLNVTSA